MGGGQVNGLERVGRPTGSSETSAPSFPLVDSSTGTCTSPCSYSTPRWPGESLGALVRFRDAPATTPRRPADVRGREKGRPAHLASDRLSSASAFSVPGIIFGLRSLPNTYVLVESNRKSVEPERDAPRPPWLLPFQEQNGAGQGGGGEMLGEEEG